MKSFSIDLQIHHHYNVLIVFTSTNPLRLSVTAINEEM